MKLARLLGITLVAVFAMSAIAASTASAIPTFKLPITLRNFSALSLASVLNNGTNVVTCTHDVASGVILNDDEVLTRVHFLGCTIVAGKEGPCKIASINNGTVKQELGLVLTNLLRGLLGLLHSPNNKAGILFAPVTGKEFVTFAATEAPCKTPEAEVEGNLAGLFAPESGSQRTAKITFNVSGAKNEITLILTLAGAVTVKLTAFGLPATEESEDNVVFEEAIEIL